MSHSGARRKGGTLAVAAETTREEYTYQIENRVFIVTPVYKEKGEPLRDILLKLMLADIEPR